jgi:hypothetical protein
VNNCRFLGTCNLHFLVKFFFGRTIVLVFFLLLSIARKYSVLLRLKVILLNFAKYTVLDWFFVFEGHYIPSFVNCFLTGITSLNITTQCWTQTRDPNTIHVMNTHGPLGSLVDPRTITLNEDSPGDDLWGLTKRQSFSEKFY